ncbi:MAG: hypothetical protein MUF27_07400 [Acidobacteria bacterium]|nr:hypothetical protein [Acidobacteriota bacterium]
MTRRGAARGGAAGALLCAALLALGCASALKEPPPVEALGGPSAAPPGASADDLLRRAGAAWARRGGAGADPVGGLAAVREARQLYLEAARADAAGVLGLLGAARASSWLVEHESDAALRAELATSAVQAAQWCQRRAPANPECDYRLALGLGQQARERQSTALDGVDRMIELLRKTIAADPALDEAGPHRALALVLLRAPGWPAGPGDAEAALVEARAAAALRPEFPPNQLVLAEALARNGDADGAAAALDRGDALARARREAGDPDAADWLAEAARLRESL